MKKSIISGSAALLIMLSSALFALTARAHSNPQSVYTSRAPILNLAISEDIIGIIIMIIGIPILTGTAILIIATRQDSSVDSTPTIAITRTSGIITIANPIKGEHGRKGGSIK